MAHEPERPSQLRPASAGRARSVAAWSVVALFSWQALASVAEVVRELGGVPFEGRVQALRASPLERIRAKLGPDFELWLALREHLPAEARVLFSFRASQDKTALLRRTVRLGTLSYPLTFLSWPHDPALPEPEPPEEEYFEYVLDLDSGRDYSGWARCEELARVGDFRLLIVGTRAR